MVHRGSPDEQKSWRLAVRLNDPVASMLAVGHSHSARWFHVFAIFSARYYRLPKMKNSLLDL
jgi:hypothetical protein